MIILYRFVELNRIKSIYVRIDRVVFFYRLTSIIVTHLNLVFFFWWSQIRIQPDGIAVWTVTAYPIGRPNFQLDL